MLREKKDPLKVSKAQIKAIALATSSPPSRGAPKN
jgi:hypothetical protein